MDTIVGLDVVLANGSYAYASSQSNPDLFYVSGRCASLAMMRC